MKMVNLLEANSKQEEEMTKVVKKVAKEEERVERKEIKKTETNN